jgi:hypothetical protein
MAAGSVGLVVVGGVEDGEVLEGLSVLHEMVEVVGHGRGIGFEIVHFYLGLVNTFPLSGVDA